MTNIPPKPHDEGRNIDLAALMTGLVKPIRRPIPTTAFITPCEYIATESFAGDSGFSTLADRYNALTEKLPLAGAPMLGRGRNDEIALIGALRAAAPWLEAAISTIEQQLRVQLWAGRPWVAWRPLCLTGPPGAGKSYLARLIGTIAGTGHATLDLGGTSDSRTLEGTPRGWNSAQPCWPAVVMSQTRTANPVLVLEEADKAGGSRQNGTSHHALLTMIERETAKAYWDKCLLADVDLSHACWILTCNDARLLPPMLRSRLDIVTVDGPGVEHFEIAVAAILHDIALGWGVPRASIPEPPPRAMRTLREAFARTRSLRRLRRHLEAIVAALVPHDRGPTH